MASIRPVPYDTIMAVQIFPFLAGRVETHHPARIVVPQRRRQVPRSVGRESFSPPILIALAQQPVRFARMANQLPPF